MALALVSCNEREIVNADIMEAPDRNTSDTSIVLKDPLDSLMFGVLNELDTFRVVNGDRKRIYNIHNGELLRTSHGYTLYPTFKVLTTRNEWEYLVYEVNVYLAPDNLTLRDISDHNSGPRNISGEEGEIVIVKDGSVLIHTPDVKMAKSELLRVIQEAPEPPAVSRFQGVYKEDIRER